MLEVIFGNSTVEKILLFLNVYGEGYAQKIANLYKIERRGVVQQLNRLEQGDVIVNQRKGQTRIYKFNPRYYFLDELRAFLEKAISVLPEEEIKKYYRLRTRPRKKGKPL